MFFLLFAHILSAQEKHFIYIQSDNRQLFYVSANGKMFSSTATGYVIIPKLENGVYNIKIGFQDTAVPEQVFECVIDKKDLGYSLKNFGAKGWGLFDLQTLGINMAGNTVAKNLAKAVAKKDEPEQPISFERKKDTAVAGVALSATPDTMHKDVAYDIKTGIEAPNNLIEGAENGTESGINKVSEKSDSSGLHLSYADKSSRMPDTIRVVIPASSSVGPPADTTIHSTLQASGLSNNSVKASPCNPATEEDFRKLRKKMASVDNDEKMIGAALKSYREKCFTTNQLRLLSTLFLSDDGRYKFFDASYEFVSDAGNYSLLQKEFVDPYYLNRFKALLRP